MNPPPPGLLVDATPHPCPYLPGRTAVLPLRWYPEQLKGEDLDALLALSDRRVGRTLYRPSCPSCQACQGIRVPVQDFALSRSQRRIWRRNTDLQVLAGPPVVDRERVDLFNRHKLGRKLGEEPTTLAHYRNWLTVSCARTLETRYLLDGRIIAIGILDMGALDASSVYFYFDPEHSERGLGTFSALAEIAWLKDQGLRYYYLGLYVEQCAHLNYKSRYYPNERLIQGQWTRFEGLKQEAEPAP